VPNAKADQRLPVFVLRLRPILDDAPAVQDYRNNLVHDGDPRKTQPIPFARAQRSSAILLGQLPPHWRP